MNPKQAMANRTARLVREAKTPTYSTRTGEARKPRKGAPVAFDEHSLCVHSVGYCGVWDD